MSRYVGEHGFPIDDDCESKRTLTDNEIIKALERCVKDGYPYGCEGCPYRAEDCNERLDADALDLINRQKAEIERLKNTLDDVLDREPILVERSEKYAKAEAIKEFAERLKKELTLHRKVCRNLLDNDGVFAIDKVRQKVDNLVKEMVGDADGC